MSPLTDLAFARSQVTSASVTPPLTLFASMPRALICDSFTSPLTLAKEMSPLAARPTPR